jgi:hypothetical protein
MFCGAFIEHFLVNIGDVGSGVVLKITETRERCCDLFAIFYPQRNKTILEVLWKKNHRGTHPRKKFLL